uniref:Uncharacterized protein n=1 Tax=Streptomyces sp. NBC_00093 TaxID=2975649 RepID=A0AAU2ABG2_9ACTN
MPEGQQTTTAPGIDYTRLGLGDDIPGLVPLVGVKTPHTVGFGIDALGKWCIEAHAADGTAPDPTQWWTAHVDSEDDISDEDEAVIDLSAYPVDNPAGAVALQEELGRRFPEATIIWKPGVMNSLDEHRTSAHRALAAAAAARIAITCRTHRFATGPAPRIMSGGTLPGPDPPRGQVRRTPPPAQKPAPETPGIDHPNPGVKSCDTKLHSLRGSYSTPWKAGWSAGASPKFRSTPAQPRHGPPRRPWWWDSDTTSTKNAST